MRQEKIHKIWNRAMECMDRAKLRELQNERLRKTVELEYANVPLYRARMDAMGVKPEDIKTVDDLRKLPFTEKTDLRDEFPYGLLAAPLKDIVRIQGSSGTTGKPIVTGYTQNDIDVWTEMVARSLTAAGGDADDVIQVCYGYGLFTGGLGAHYGASAIGATVIPMSAGNTQRQMMMMTELGATMLCCTPSYATYLGETLKEAGLLDKVKTMDLPTMREIKTSIDNLTRTVQTEIQNVSTTKTKVTQNNTFNISGVTGEEVAEKINNTLVKTFTGMSLNAYQRSMA